MSAASAPLEIVIVGTGFAGLGLAIRLRRAGYANFVLLERARALGGTWRDNDYPGCACDIPSELYSFSFAPNRDWSRIYPTQPELRAYLERCAERFDREDTSNGGEMDTGDSNEAIDPICEMTVNTADALSANVGDTTYYFCAEGCRTRFLENQDLSPGQQRIQLQRKPRHE